MKLRLLSRSLLVGALGAIVLVSPLRAGAPATRTLRGGVGTQSNMLQPGRRIEARTVRGATDTYTVSIAAGQYMHVVVEHPQLKVVARVRGNDGLVIDGLGGPDLQVHGRPDRIVLIAESPTDYQIDLTTIDGDGNGYAIAIVEQGELNAVERQRFEAQRLRANAVAGTTGRPWTRERRAQLERSRAISREIGDPIGEVDALLSLGLSYLQSDRPAGRPYFLVAIDVAARAADLRSELEAVNNLGETAIAMGEPRQAADYLLRGLEVGRQIDPSWPNVLLIYNLSLSYRNAGEFQLALRYGHEALAHWREAGDTAGEGYAANNIGMTHFLLGDTDTALEYLTLAFDRWRSVQHGTGIARSLTTIGFARAARGEHREAIDNFREAITAWRAIDATGDVFGESDATRSLAMSLAAVGRWHEAAPIYERALSLARQSGGKIVEADTLRGLGELRRATGDPAQAAVLFEQSLTMARASEDRSGMAATLLALARLARERGRLDESQSLIEEALGLIESLRTTVSSPDLRASFAATKRDYYDFYIDLLMQLHRRNPGAGHEVAALMASERGRARSLLEMLTETGADIRAGAPSALLEKERVLQQDVTIRAARLTRLLGGAHTDPQAAAARAELQHAVTAYDDAQSRVRAESPRYAALSQPAPLDLQAMRARVLDGETALIEYALGQERSFAWVVTRDSLSAYELPSRAVIEEAARQAHDLLAGSNRREVWGPAARAAARLSDLILAPVMPRLSHRRLLVVADGALHYVPFAALPKPGSSAPMVAAYEIVNLPSASALAVIRDEAAGRKPAANRVAVLADPVLAPSDARVSGAPATTDRPAAGRSDLLRSATESGIPHFERLAFTRDEANAIAAIAGRSRSMVSLDFNASRATALGTALADYRVVHFATHGLINSANPRLSGLVLSLVDRQGNQQDGFVRLHDIYNMKLAADLVVLSACRTALGKDVRGEGLVGMTRGFMYAGAPRVVASLWDVRDSATAELMKRFYARMLTDGLSPAAALRAAQVSMWKEPRWQAPFNWAGFVIQGEWK